MTSSSLAGSHSLCHWEGNHSGACLPRLSITSNHLYLHLEWLAKRWSGWCVCKFTCMCVWRGGRVCVHVHVCGQGGDDNSLVYTMHKVISMCSRQRANSDLNACTWRTRPVCCFTTMYIHAVNPSFILNFPCIFFLLRCDRFHALKSIISSYS